MLMQFKIPKLNYVCQTINTNLSAQCVTQDKNNKKNTPISFLFDSTITSQVIFIPYY